LGGNWGGGCAGTREPFCYASRIETHYTGNWNEAKRIILPNGYSNDLVFDAFGSEPEIVTKVNPKTQVPRKNEPGAPSVSLYCRETYRSDILWTILMSTNFSPGHPPREER
jgi:hypothetical protein